jgi:hypothetical protein
VGGLLYLVLGYDPTPGQGVSLPYVVWHASSSVVSWSAIVFIVSLGAKYLNFTNGLLAYSNEAVLPFFLFHQSVILTVGWYVLPWAIPNLLKYAIIALISFSLILGLYELFVRHIGVMRFLFGMAPKKKRATAPAETLRVRPV